MSVRQTDVNGDPRYGYSDTEYYSLRSSLLSSSPTDILFRVFGVEDSEDGYIAFTTDPLMADLIVRALDAYEES